MGIQRKERSSEGRPFLSFVRNYRVEIAGMAVVVVGIFLLAEQMNIRGAVIRWLRNILDLMIRGMGRLGDSAGGFVTALTLSDALGILLILGALIAMVSRVRWRLLRSPALTALRCPKCGGSFHRVHRRFGDRLVNVFVPVRRYRCSNQECRWSGLRVDAHQQTRAASTR